jgi:hypothetical protein
MTASAIAASELAELLDLAERLGRLLPRLAEALAAAQRERETLLCELTTRAPRRWAAPPGRFPHLGAIVRWLRQAAGLTRAQLEVQTGLPESTILKIETARRQLTASTLRKLLAHPAMAALPEWAQAAGLPLVHRDRGGGSS